MPARASTNESALSNLYRYDLFARLDKKVVRTPQSSKLFLIACPRIFHVVLARLRRSDDRNDDMALAAFYRDWHADCFNPMARNIAKQMDRD